RGRGYLDFLRSPRACPNAPQKPVFPAFGLSWISLDSLVRNEPFQWVTAALGRKNNLRTPPSRRGRSPWDKNRSRWHGRWVAHEGIIATFLLIRKKMSLAPWAGCRAPERPMVGRHSSPRMTGWRNVSQFP